MGVTVCIGGLIAAGKTTFIDKLSNWWNHEGVSYKILAEVYPEAMREMINTNLPVGDAFMLAHRLQMGIDAPEIAKSYDIVLMERCFIDHIAFIEAFEDCGMTTPELVAWSKRVVEEVNAPIPDQFIYLDVASEISLERKRARSQGGDDIFDLAFTHALKEAYERLIFQYYEDPIVLNWSQFDHGLCLKSLTERLLSSNPRLSLQLPIP